MQLKTYWATGSQVSVMTKIKLAFVLLTIVHLIYWAIKDNIKEIVLWSLPVVYSIAFLLFLWLEYGIFL
jgi:hypothetical protein